MSGNRKFCARPAAAVTASAAMYPLRTAPSIVEGQPERVQSPARNRFRMGVRVPGRSGSSPGMAEKVARIYEEVLG